MPSIIIQHKGIDYRCLFDERDHELVKKYNWSIHPEGYAVSYCDRQIIYMHRLIMGVKDPSIEVDHVYHNKLDNRRKQLRICTRSQNMQNARKLKPGTSRFKGLYRDNGRWHAQISVNGRTFNLGRYRSEQIGARIYDRAAQYWFGEFAYLNFPEDRLPKESLPTQLIMSL